MTVGKRVTKPKRQKLELDRLIAADYPLPEDMLCVEILIPNDLKYLYALQGFYAQMTNTWAWEGTAEDRQSRAMLVLLAYTATDWEQCMNCEQLIECLQPLFDAIEARFDTLDTSVSLLQTVTDAIQGMQEASAAQPIILPEVVVANSICGGAYALVREMDRINRVLYQEAEDSFVDNAAEWISTILDVFPMFAAQGVNAGAEVANHLAGSNVTSYGTAYDSMEDTAVGLLRCYIEANSGVLDYNVWGDWLDDLPSQFSPANFAADLYARYSPLRQTWINQLLEQINGEISLQEYFDNLWNVYYTGTTTPITCPIFVCPDAKAQNVGIIGSTGEGVKSTVEFTAGVPFDIDAYEETGVTDSYIIALKLPIGNWEVILNSITGTIIAPPDTSETAYAWIDTTGAFHNVLWNVPAEPDEFGTQETTFGIFAPWSTTQPFNAALFNHGAFSANFTVNAL